MPTIEQPTHRFAICGEVGESSDFLPCRTRPATKRLNRCLGPHRAESHSITAVRHCAAEQGGQRRPDAWAPNSVCKPLRHLHRRRARTIANGFEDRTRAATTNERAHGAHPRRPRNASPFRCRVKQHAHRTPRRESEQITQLLGGRGSVGNVGEENGPQWGTTVSKPADVHERRGGHIQRKAAHGLHGTTPLTYCILGELLGPNTRDAKRFNLRWTPERSWR